jgi:hypothetical protein
MDFTDFLRESALRDLDLVPVLLSLLLALVFGQILSWHYQRFAPVLSNKRKFGRMFVYLVTTTMLVIAVVKTSLALSLGLVGALSIIRFRTPIKEPEDLAYLFLAVAVGIGLGADQRIVTGVVFAGILAYMSLVRSGSAGNVPPRMLVHVSSSLDGGGDGPRTPEDALGVLLREAESKSSQVDLRRVDMAGSEFNANLILDLHDPGEVGALIQRIQTALPAASVSVVEGSGLD